MVLFHPDSLERKKSLQTEAFRLARDNVTAKKMKSELNSQSLLALKIKRKCKCKLDNKIYIK